MSKVEFKQRWGDRASFTYMGRLHTLPMDYILVLEDLLEEGRDPEAWLVQALGIFAVHRAPPRLAYQLDLALATGQHLDLIGRSFDLSRMQARLTANCLVRETDDCYRARLLRYLSTPAPYPTPIHYDPV